MSSEMLTNKRPVSVGHMGDCPVRRNWIFLCFSCRRANLSRRWNLSSRTELPRLSTRDEEARARAVSTPSGVSLQAEDPFGLCLQFTRSNRLWSPRRRWFHQVGHSHLCSVQKGLSMAHPLPGEHERLTLSLVARSGSHCQHRNETEASGYCSERCGSLYQNWTDCWWNATYVWPSFRSPWSFDKQSTCTADSTHPDSLCFCLDFSSIDRRRQAVFPRRNDQTRLAIDNRVQKATQYHLNHDLIFSSFAESISKNPELNHLNSFLVHSLSVGRIWARQFSFFIMCVHPYLNLLTCVTTWNWQGRVLFTSRTY